MTKISAEVVADSLSPQGDRLTSLLITFPRMILAEVNTHRMLSKNTASSRAIPFKKMVESVQNDPFIPIAWQMDHRGMQGAEYLTDLGGYLKGSWLQARDLAVNQAKLLNSLDCTKQLCNRLLEPFMWTTMLITGSKEGWENFFELRCPQYYHKSDITGTEQYLKSKSDWLFVADDGTNRLEEHNRRLKENSLLWFELNRGQAEIHMMALAEAIYDARKESSPRQLGTGEWHIPFEKRIPEDIIELVDEPLSKKDLIIFGDDSTDLFVKVSTAMSARTSYTLVGDEKEVDYRKMIELHDKLIVQNPLHASPMEHCARAMNDDEYLRFYKSLFYKEGYESYKERGWCRNYRGFIQYRHFLESGNETNT